PGRARPHLPRTPTFGAFPHREAPPTRHDGQLSRSEQQKTRFPADLRPGSGYFRQLECHFFVSTRSWSCRESNPSAPNRSPVLTSFLPFAAEGLLAPGLACRLPVF